MAKAWVAFQMGKYASTIADYGAVLDVDAGNGTALANRGAILELMGLGDGLTDLDLADVLNPHGARVPLLKALALRHRRRSSEALDQFQRALQRGDAGAKDIDTEEVGRIHNALGVIMLEDDGDLRKQTLRRRQALLHFQKAARHPVCRCIAMQNAGQILVRTPMIAYGPV